MHIGRRRFLLGTGAMALATLIPVPRVLAAAKSTDPDTTELTARVTNFNLGEGKAFKAWSFNDGIPGPVYGRAWVMPSGGKDMPAFSDLKPEELDAVIAFLKTL